MTIEKLDAAIKEVCPIDGVDSDRVISFKPEATLEQKTAAQSIANEWDFAEAVTIEVLTEVVQAHLDAQAVKHHYDNIVSACSYAATPNLFQSESQAFLVWRANCWAKCYEVMGAVKASARSVPTPEELLAELPLLALP